MPPSIQPELKAIAQILELHLDEELELKQRGVQHWIDDIYGSIISIRRHSGQWELSPSAPENQVDHYLRSLHMRRFEHKFSTIEPEDEVVFRVYCADHSFATLRTRVDEKAAEIKQLAARKLNLVDKQDQLILVHVKSNGERIIYNDMEFNISTSLSVNGRIFVCPLDHIDAISPLPEQDPFQEVYQGLPPALVAAPSSTAAAAATATTTNVTATPSAGPDSFGASSAGGAIETATTCSDLTVPANGSAGKSQGLQQQQPIQGSGVVSSQTTPAVQQPISSHLLTSTPTNYADIKMQMSLSVNKLEEFSSRDIAYCLTQIAWNLLKNMHEFELIYTVFGRHNFKQITANMNVFLRHFNEIQYWVVTQICLSSSLSKRVQILRKFIKIAAQ